MESRYLGDGVYVSYKEGMLLLTTGNHQEALAEQKIWLEPEVAMGLLTFIQQSAKEYGWSK